MVSSKIKLAGLSVQRQNDRWEKNVAVVPKQRDGHNEAISKNCLSLSLSLSVPHRLSFSPLFSLIRYVPSTF